MKILLLDSDITYCKQLMNAISCLSETVRISFIANNLKEISEVFNIDIILANYEFYNGELEVKYDSAKIIYLTENYDTEGIDKELRTVCRTNIDLIIETVLKVSGNISDSYLEKAIIAEISFLGYNFAHTGTQHLIDILKILYKSDEDCYNVNLEKDIYSILSKHFGIPVRTLKGNINYATNKMLDECEKKKLSTYLGFHVSRRPGSKTVICAILEKLKLKVSK